MKDNDIVMISFRVTRGFRNMLKAEAARRDKPMKDVFIISANAWLKMKGAK